MDISPILAARVPSFNRSISTLPLAAAPLITQVPPPPAPPWGASALGSAFWILSPFRKLAARPRPHRSCLTVVNAVAPRGLADQVRDSRPSPASRSASACWLLVSVKHWIQTLRGLRVMLTHLGRRRAVFQEVGYSEDDLLLSAHSPDARGSRGHPLTASSRLFSESWGSCLA